MILHVPNVLTGEQVARCRETIMQSKWVDGRVTAGHQSALVKNNLQLPEDSTEARELGDMILAALERHPLVYFSGVAVPRLPTDLQPLRCWHVAGHACGQLHSAGHRHAVSRPHRSRGHALPEPTGRIRWRGVGGRRCLWSARRQVTRWGDGALSGDQFASRHACVGAAPGWRRSSGYKVWSGMIATAGCSSSSTWPSIRSTRCSRTMRRW